MVDYVAGPCVRIFAITWFFVSLFRDKFIKNPAIAAVEKNTQSKRRKRKC